MCQEYAIPHHTGSGQTTPSTFAMGSHTPVRPPPPLHNFLPKPPPVPPPPEQYYAAAEICNAGSLPPTSLTPPPSAGVPTGKISSLFMLPLSPDLEDSSGHEEEDVDIFEFPRDILRLIDDFGESRYGQVHLCEVQRSPLQLDSNVCNLVVVNMLQHDSVRTEFIREARTLSKLKDINVARLLGACLESDPLCMIREYAEFGDLCQFLQDHIAETTSLRPPTANTLRLVLYASTDPFVLAQRFSSKVHFSCSSNTLFFTRMFCLLSVTVALFIWQRK